MTEATQPRDRATALNIEMREPWHRDALLSWQANNLDALASARRIATAYGKSGTLEVTAAICALLDEVERLTDERDNSAECLRDVLLRRIQRWERRGKDLQDSSFRTNRLIGRIYLDRVDDLRHDLEAVSDG
jgi:hypothetical protein